jgi:hypothetical protein
MDDSREALLRETREELAKADAKASILLAASGIALSALLTVSNKAPWYPDNLTELNARRCAWAAAALMIVGMLLVGAAVKPRLRAKHGTTPVVHYFGDVEAFRPPWWRVWRRDTDVDEARTRFSNALADLVDSDAAHARLVDQIWTLSHIAYRKYRFVGFGIWSFAAALALAVVALFIEKQWV